MKQVDQKDRCDTSSRVPTPSVGKEQWPFMTVCYGFRSDRISFSTALGHVRQANEGASGSTKVTSRAKLCTVLINWPPHRWCSYSTPCYSRTCAIFTRIFQSARIFLSVALRFAGQFISKIHHLYEILCKGRYRVGTCLLR